jgi:uncharacterized repeat protein (TIGR02543 family)
MMKKNLRIGACILTAITALALGGCPQTEGGGTQYTITFDSNGGSAVASIRGNAGAEVDKPEDPAKQDAKFNGWFSASSGGAAYTWPHTLIADVTMYAQWREDRQYTITFNSNGGSPVQAVTALEGTAIAKPDDPTRAGYKFSGWFDAATGGAAYAWPHTLTKNVTMYAWWREERQYTVSFASDGGSAVQAVTALEGAAITKPADPTQEGYTFTGWFDPEGVLYTWPYLLTGDVTMYARWRDSSLPPPAQRTLTFDSQGGQAVPSVTADEGTKLTKPGNPEKTGHTFEGWFGAAAGGTAYTWPHTLSADLTMYAQWAAVTYTAVYNPNGGTGTTATSSHTYGQAKALTGNGFTRTGYTFGGWNTAANGSGAPYADGASVTNLRSTGGEVTLYAQWWPDVFVTISIWENEDGTILDNDTTGTITISKSDEDHESFIATVNEAYSDVRWYLDDEAGIRGTGQSITIKAGDYVTGKHRLRVTVTKGEASYSTVIHFTVAG